jgi:uncharacterized protein (TIGR02284 family)
MGIRASRSCQNISKTQQVKAFFVKESQTRAQYANELEFAAALKREEGGTAAGAMHRFWGDLKGKLGGEDNTLLETAEQGEDAGKEAYQKAPKENAITEPVRQILVTQQSHVQQSHDTVKGFPGSQSCVRGSSSCEASVNRWGLVFLVPDSRTSANKAMGCDI